jgi:xanthine dehydrogenase FAD-binding subunit
MEGGKVRDVRIALGSVAPTVLRCKKTEGLLRGRAISDALSEARKQLRAEISPLDDFRSTADYRTRVAQNILEEFLLHAQSSTIS